MGNIIKLTRFSEKKYKLGNFKGAIDDKRTVNAILKSKYCDEIIIEKYQSHMYAEEQQTMFKEMGVKTFYIGKSLDDSQRATVIFSRTRKCSL